MRTEEEINEARDALAQQIASVLADGDVQHIGVFPVIEDGYHFCYTVGRHFHDLPELIVTGISSRGEGFLREVAARWDTHPGAGTPWAFGDGSLMTLELSDQVRDEHMTVTRSFVGDDFVALQVVWQDDEGLWPWDKDDPTLPVLGEHP